MALLTREGKWVWLTAAGERPGPAGRREALRLYPDLVRVGQWMVRPGAIRRVQRLGVQGRVVLCSGHEIVASWLRMDDLVRALGLPHPDLAADLPGHHRVVYERGLRDWPEELLRMPPETLRSIAGGDVVRLVDLALWQIFRMRSQGRELPYGRNPRGLFYNPMVLLAERAGLLSGPVVSRERLPEWLTGADGHQLAKYVEERLQLFVGEWRLCTYAGLGCLDLGEKNRRLGGARPHVILLVEKDSLDPEARIVAEMFDVTLLVLGGAPTYIGIEFLVAALAGRLQGPVILVAFCDFDPYGWHFPVAASAQFERYGVATRAIVRLVKPSRFSDEELDLVALPLPSGSQGPEVERWFAETGGVKGRRLGIYADYLRPVERVIEAFRQETGLEPVVSMAEACSRAGLA